MSTPNPLAPQGSLLEQHGRGRSTFQIISFIGGLHVVFLCGLLWIGCKREETPQVGGTDGMDAMPPVNHSVDPTVPPAGVDPVAVASPSDAGVGAMGSGADVPPVEAFPGFDTTTTVPPPPVLTPDPVIPGVAAGPVTSTPAAAPATHKVAKGEWGVTIARRYGISLKALQDANPTINWTRLKVDQELVIPASGPAPQMASAAPAGASGADGYVVQSGDTGLRIARKFGVAWKDIRRANNLTSDTLRIGQELVIPRSSATAAPLPGGTPRAVALPPR